ncbi:MAG: uncharacterized protein KVP18_002297 [Porospora cf. gigantea A]|uniref:uncharacterized protein n=1 Tax=Porospora cf. gigantea A TaxID=2853593 RepID=UPI003559D9CA|nr:MAG: hypothetical protein KVP18_002297 [Porospora cf. gigantea A]
MEAELHPTVMAPCSESGTESSGASGACGQVTPVQRSPEVRVTPGAPKRQSLISLAVADSRPDDFTSSQKDLGSDRFHPLSYSSTDLFQGKSAAAGFFTVAKKKDENDRASVLFTILADGWDRIEALKGSGSGSKKKSIVILCNVFRLLLVHSPKDLERACWLSLSKLAPNYEAVETGIGDGLLLRAVSEFYNRSEANIRADLVELEDLGLVASQSRSSMRTLLGSQPLTIESVFSTMRGIADISGTNAQTQKKNLVKRLLSAASSVECKFLVRFLQAKLRIGIQAASVISALGACFVLSPCNSTGVTADVRGSESDIAEMEAAVKRALSEVPDIGFVVQCLINGEGPKTLPSVCHIMPGRPVLPMLAKPVKSVSTVFDRFAESKFTCEYKYDGERGQLHISNGTVRIFSRNMEDMTSKYPDVVRICLDALLKTGTECIVDAEIVAFDPEKGILPFQVLSTRKRKDVSEANIETGVCVYAFDILFMTEPLLQRSLAERRRLLHQCFAESAGRFQFASFRDCDNTEELDTFLQASVDANCEGLMVKALESHATYQPSLRSRYWLKLKKDYIDAIGDSVDVVPVGVFYGKGKRSGVFGAFLSAVYDAGTETFQTVCKIGTGFTDQSLGDLHQKLSGAVAERQPRSVDAGESKSPDLWLTPTFVWEIKAADLSISPVHTAGSHLNDGRGISLRFPRFLRERPDKKPYECTDTSQILEMFKEQFAKRGEEDDEEDLLI